MQIDLGKDFFELFGLSRSFDLDVTRLAEHYRELQRNIHPDKFSAASAPERRLSMQFTTHVNEAYQTLKDPIRRGRYLLRLRGVDTNEETDTVMDSAFLMEQMELREAMEEARHAPNRDALITDLIRDVEARLQQKSLALSQSLASEEPHDLQHARAVVREMQFLEKSLRELHELEEF